VRLSHLDVHCGLRQTRSASALVDGGQDPGIWIVAFLFLWMYEGHSHRAEGEQILRQSLTLYGICPWMGSKWAVSGERHFQASEKLQDMWGKIGSLSARGARGHWWPVTPIKTLDLESKDRVEAHGEIPSILIGQNPSRDLWCITWSFLEMVSFG
jgi:hypothetical protein